MGDGVTAPCPDCGARLAEAETCRERFGACLSLEYQNPATFGAVHHLSVICYALQHNGYSRAAWIDARDLLARCLHENLTGADLLRITREKLGNRKNGSINRGPRLKGVSGVVWTVTVADVDTTDLAAYETGVRRWAASVVADTVDFTPS